MNGYISHSKEVGDALASGIPVVALESTIISHGMPYPRNVETAREAEKIARDMGVVPAVIAVLDGKIRVGVEREEMERLGRGEGILKISRRDIAHALTRGLLGATTVSATMLAAHLAGIDVFATGGIGGVHRGAAESFDLSADLTELASTSVCVVCAGAKAVLDIPKTLEILETLGVPVVGFRTDQMPAFYSRESGVPAPLRVESAEEVAEMLAIQRGLGLPQGILVANPVAREREIPLGVMDAFIERALGEMAKKGVTGKEVTPFLLSRIVELSGGKSLETNIALFHENVKLACGIALALKQRG
jgi:pseudouridine-5'-phosphate glycosidase